jgi:predicted MFS family arabinose efflux permease
MDPQWIGIFLATCGVAGSAGSLVLGPSIQRRLGHATTIQAGLLTIAVSFALMPLAAFWVARFHSNTNFGTLAVLGFMAVSGTIVNASFS